MMRNTNPPRFSSFTANDAALTQASTQAAQTSSGGIRYTPAQMQAMGAAYALAGALPQWSVDNQPGYAQPGYGGVQIAQPGAVGGGVTVDRGVNGGGYDNGWSQFSAPVRYALENNYFTPVGPPRGWSGDWAYQQSMNAGYDWSTPWWAQSAEARKYMQRAQNYGPQFVGGARSMNYVRRNPDKGYARWMNKVNPQQPQQPQQAGGNFFPRWFQGLVSWKI